MQYSNDDHRNRYNYAMDANDPQFEAFFDKFIQKLKSNNLAVNPFPNAVNPFPNSIVAPQHPVPIRKYVQTTQQTFATPILIPSAYSAKDAWEQ